MIIRTERVRAWVPGEAGGGESQTPGTLCGAQIQFGLYFEGTEKPVTVLNMKVMYIILYFENFVFILK